jgi:hypothetical protein
MDFGIFKIHLAGKYLTWYFQQCIKKQPQDKIQIEKLLLHKLATEDGPPGILLLCCFINRNLESEKLLK